MKKATFVFLPTQSKKSEYNKHQGIPVKYYWSFQSNAFYQYNESLPKEPKGKGIDTSQNVYLKNNQPLTPEYKK